ncbi:hypothetical protein PG997_014152 [Apiospora hydei]|uniref:Uncharacterized protein n=1 Tax=Apiospora hydei TaxID=1337664 RepID=A0ABR1V885_9PEZI
MWFTVNLLDSIAGLTLPNIDEASSPTQVYAARLMQLKQWVGSPGSKANPHRSGQSKWHRKVSEKREFLTTVRKARAEFWTKLVDEAHQEHQLAKAPPQPKIAG